MQCYNCGAQLTEKDFCTNCGADVSNFKKLISFSNYYYNQGLEKAQVRDLSGAVESLKLCLKLNKYHIEARNLLGLVYFETGETVAALSEWVISKNLRPEKNVADDYIDAVQKSLRSWKHSRREAGNSSGPDLLPAGQQGSGGDPAEKGVVGQPQLRAGSSAFGPALYRCRGMEKAKKELNRCLKIDRANTTALRYMKEVESALKVEEEGRLPRRQNREDAIKYQSGNETIIQPVNRMEPKKNAGWLWTLLIGAAAGLAVAWFLILPARIQSAKTQLNDSLVSVGEEVDRKNAQIDSLTQQVESLTRENADLTAQTEALAGTTLDRVLMEALLNAAYIYIETPEDMEALSEAIDQIDQETMESADTPEAARNLYAKLLEDTGTDLANAYYDAGYQAYRANDFDTAIENLQKAVNYDPENEEALFALANSYREKGNRRMAIDTYEQVIELFPGTQKAGQSQNYIDDLQE